MKKREKEKERKEIKRKKRRENISLWKFSKKYN